MTSGRKLEISVRWKISDYSHSNIKNPSLKSEQLFSVIPNHVLADHVGENYTADWLSACLSVRCALSTHTTDNGNTPAWFPADTWLLVSTTNFPPVSRRTATRTLTRRVLWAKSVSSP